MPEVTAAEMARRAGVDPKRFRAALRRSIHIHIHVLHDRWTTITGSDEHRRWQGVLGELVGGGVVSIPHEPLAAGVRAGRIGSDETYILDLCDEVLGLKGHRQHRFPFLLGDPGRSGRAVALPVDTWYPTLGLVIEYRERQHMEAVAFFDRRLTVSGVGRGEQRKRYDQRRRDVLAREGVSLIELNCTDFACVSAKRLGRVPADREVVTRRLAHFLSRQTGSSA